MAEVACVAALSGRAPSEVVKLLDPTVGRGVMLQTISRGLASMGSEVHAIGIDINQEAIESTLVSIGANPVGWTPRLGNILTDDVVPYAGMDLVVSEPPWGIGWKGDERAVKERSQEGWYPRGLGRVTDAGWLFLQRGLAAMKPREHGGSRFVTFVNPKLLFDREGRECRRWLVEEDLLEAVVRLPAGLAELAVIPLYALVLRTDKPASLLGRAHVIDLRGYTTTRDSGARRRISGDGLKLLWSALETRRQGPSNRIVSLDSFMRQQVTVSANSDPMLSFRTETSSSNPSAELQHRYGPVPVEWSEEGPGFVSFNVDRFFDSPGHRSYPRGGEFTRLSALLIAPPEVNSPDQESTGAADDVIYLPTGRGQVTTTPTQPAGRVLRLHLNSEVVHPEYLAGWLNSDQGRLAVQTALDRGSSGEIINAVRSDTASLWRLMDELRVPVRPTADQLLLAESLLKLRRVEALVQAARADLWSRDKAAELVTSPFEPLLDESLERWTASLPYPFATALWTLTSRNSVDARHRQIFHTWESYATFVATVLLSALRQDSDLAEVEGAGLRRALDKQGLSLERASFGTWVLVIQRLSARFRELLSDNADDRARVSQMFGGAPPAAIDAIIQPECVQLLSDVNAKRNQWMGHSGAASESALQTQIDYLTSALEQLRSLVGEAWTRLPLVRAGKASSRRGELLQEVELVMGTNVPFRPDSFTVGAIMDEGELYLATDGCAQPVPLSQLIVLRSAPASDRFACYFFNRADAAEVRMVSYQTTDTGEITEARADFAEHLDWLWSPSRGTGEGT
ncbi:MAG: SAM-dependent methyltransferase [Actinobacteria bacterium]|nr:SAM-dependent methyltransferase [Actinomycetota bacterium]